MKDWKKIFNENSNQKIAEVAMLISNKTYFKQKKMLKEIKTLQINKRVSKRYEHRDKTLICEGPKGRIGKRCTKILRDCNLISHIKTKENIKWKIWKHTNLRLHFENEKITSENFPVRC